jgi:hypothetical protein
VLGHERDQFVNEVVRPTLRSPRGEPRLRRADQHLDDWADRPGGCLFVAAASELDDEQRAAAQATGAGRARLARHHRPDRRRSRVGGALPPDIDAEQLAFDVHAAMLGYHHASRLLADPRARDRLSCSIEALLRNVRASTAD